MKSLHATHRVWKNKAAQKVLEIEAGNGKPEEIFVAAAGAKARKMYEEGDLDVGVTSCGQGVGLIDDIPTVRELFERMTAEAEEIIGRMKGLVS